MSCLHRYTTLSSVQRPAESVNRDELTDTLIRIRVDVLAGCVARFAIGAMSSRLDAFRGKRKRNHPHIGFHRSKRTLWSRGREGERNPPPSPHSFRLTSLEPQLRLQSSSGMTQGHGDNSSTDPPGGVALPFRKVSAPGPELYFRSHRNCTSAFRGTNSQLFRSA